MTVEAGERRYRVTVTVPHAAAMPVAGLEVGEQG